MRILRGKSFDNPIVLIRSDVDKNKMVMQVEQFDAKQSQSMPQPTYAASDSCVGFLDVLFGGNDFSYFIKSESCVKNEKGTYKIYFVEDKDGDSHSIFFLIKE